MSARPETLELLDRMFGTDRQVGDQLDRLEMVEVDYRSIVEELVRTANDLLDADQGSEEYADAITELTSIIKWAERETDHQSALLLDAVAAIDSLVGAR